MSMRTIIVLTMTLLLAPCSASAAVTFVTACASDTQQGAGVNLAQALHAGGSIYFNCPTVAVIRVNGNYTVPGATFLDGGGTVTLDGQGLPLTLIKSRASVVLRRITIRNFAGEPQPRFGRVFLGSVLRVADNAVLDHVTIEGSDHPVGVRGDLQVEDSTFVGNRGVVLHADGLTTIARSTFLSNKHGVWIERGHIHGSTFRQNQVAVSVHTGTGPIEILHNTFERNAQALEMSQQCIWGTAVTVSVRGNRFQENIASAISLYDIVKWARDRYPSWAWAAAMLARLPPARFTLAYNQFLNNAGAQGAAIDADLRNTAGMTITGDLFIGNVAAAGGGAIAQRGGVLAISHSLFRNNHSGGAGAAVQGVPGSGGQLSISNSLIVENVGTGGAVDADTVDLANVTIAANGSGGLTVRGASTVANAILSRNRSGNCTGVTAAAFRGGNLQFGAADCPGVAVGDPLLDALYVPEFGSQALALGDAAICSSAPVLGMDIIFQARHSQRVCALGAFERPPLRHAPKPGAGGEKPGAGGDMKGRSLAAAVVCLASAVPAYPAEPLDLVLAAFSVNEAAAKSRSVLTIDVDGAVDVYVIERVKPDRLRVVHNPERANAQEAVTIGSVMYVRRPGGWSSGPAVVAAPGAIPSIEGLFKSGISNLKECTAAAGAQRFSGRITWSNGGTEHDGQIDILIDVGTAMLRTVAFEGICGTKACRFSQTFSHDTSLTISTPK